MLSPNYRYALISLSKHERGLLLLIKIEDLILQVNSDRTNWIRVWKMVHLRM